LQEVDTVNIVDLLTEVIEQLKPVFGEKRLEVRLLDSTPVNIRCEPFLVRQAVGNLLQNAVDFSREGGTITVSVKEGDGFLAVTIRDNGYGIPEYARSKVFDRFYSLQRPDTGKKSSGLGLAFVREVANLHGGQATVDNCPEGGVAATITIAVS
jgi:two-component system, OmpR family, sensor histidine kinase CreC